MGGLGKPLLEGGALRHLTITTEIIVSEVSCLVSSV